MPMLRPVLGILTFLAALLMLADGPLTAQDKGKAAGKKGTPHDATLIKVDPKGHTIEVEFHDKKKKKHQHYKLTESVKIVGPDGHFTKLEVFKKGDHIKIVEHEGQIHELHHKGHKGKDPGKK